MEWEIVNKWQIWSNDNERDAFCHSWVNICNVAFVFEDAAAVDVINYQWGIDEWIPKLASKAMAGDHWATIL